MPYSPARRSSSACFASFSRVAELSLTSRMSAITWSIQAWWAFREWYLLTSSYSPNVFPEQIRGPQVPSSLRLEGPWTGWERSSGSAAFSRHFGYGPHRIEAECRGGGGGAAKITVGTVIPHPFARFVPRAVPGVFSDFRGYYHQLSPTPYSFDH